MYIRGRLCINSWVNHRIFSLKIFFMVYVISALGKAPFSAGDLVPLTVPAQVYREVLRGNFVGGATSF